MMRSLLAVSWTALVLSACGAAGQPDKIQTPDQFIAEEDAEGAKQIAAEKKQESNSGAPTETEDEKVRDWDDKQATLEMKRAARSAETCPDSVTEKAPKGMATVTLLFANDGKVKDSKIDDVYSDKAVGTCVLRAQRDRAGLQGRRAHVGLADRPHRREAETLRAEGQRRQGAVSLRRAGAATHFRAATRRARPARRAGRRTPSRPLPTPTSGDPSI